MSEELNEISKRLYNAFIAYNDHDKFNMHSQESQWGFTILFMEKSGLAFCRTYIHKDCKDAIVFDCLTVDESVRKQGIATELLNTHIEVAKYLGLESCLCVEQDTWVHEWYKRKGYKYLRTDEDEDNRIWMSLPFSKNYNC